VLKSKKLSSIPQYELQTESLTENKLRLTFNISESEYQAEREFMFYALHDLLKCKVEELDSVEVVFHEVSKNRSKQFAFNRADLLAHLQIRDSLSFPLYHLAMSKLLSTEENYLMAVTVCSHFLGAVIYNNDDGMYNEDFLDFLYSYTKDIQEGNTESGTFTVMDSIEGKIKESGLQPDIKEDVLEFMKYVKNFKERKGA
jgi:hypothetical protein